MILNGLVSLKSAFPVTETLDRLTQQIESRGFTVFCRIDHAANAVGAATTTAMRALLGAVTQGAAMP